MLAALAAVTLWSTNAFGAELALGEMGLGWLLLVQFSTASGALLVVRAVQDRRPVRTAVTGSPASGPERPDRTAIVIGIVGLTGTMFLQYLAFATAPIVAANVLAYAWPLLAAIWLAVTRRNRHASVSAGLAVLGFAGIGLIFTGPSQSTAEVASPAGPWGYVAALGSAVCMAIYTLGASRRPETGSSSVLIPATLAGVAAAIVVAALDDGPAPTVTGVLAAACLGLGPMAAGYLLWTRAMSGGGAERLSPLGYATPLLSTVLLLATGASSDRTTFVGIGLVLGCSLCVLAYDGYARRERLPAAVMRITARSPARK